MRGNPPRSICVSGVCRDEVDRFGGFLLLAAKLALALIENRLVQARLGFDAAPWRRNRANSRFAHIGDFQVFDHNPKFVGLQAFHNLNYICATKPDHQIACVKVVFEKIQLFPAK